MAIFVLATFANRVAEMTWVLFTSYRFHWGPTETGLSLAAVGVMFVVGQGGLVRVDRAAARRAPRDPARAHRQRDHVGALRHRAARLDGVPRDGPRGVRLDDRATGRAGADVAGGAAQRAGTLAGRAREHDESHVDRRPADLDRPVRLLRVGAAPIIVPGAAFFAAAVVFAVALVLAHRWFAASPSPRRPEPVSARASGRPTE